MKILFVTPYFYPKIGGLENYALKIAEGLRNNHNCEIVVVTSNHLGKQLLIEYIKNIKVYRLPIQLRLSNTPINLSWAKDIHKIIEFESPDLINAHTPVPYISDITERKRGKIPFILTYQNDLMKESYVLNLICKLYYLLLGNKTLEKSDVIIASSEYYANKSIYLSKYKSKIAIIPPGVDTKVFNINVDKRFLKNKFPSSFIVTFVAQLDKTHMHKGLFFLIDAIIKSKEEIPHLILNIIGQGNFLPEYREYILQRKANNYINLLGFISSEELPLYMAGSDVLCLPSYNASEGFGMVLIEAQACGTSVVGSDIGGIPHVVINNKTGLLVPPKNIPALSAAIITLFKNENLRNSLVENALVRVTEEFSWDVLVEKTYKLFASKVKNNEKNLNTSQSNLTL